MSRIQRIAVGAAAAVVIVVLFFVFRPSDEDEPASEPTTGTATATSATTETTTTTETAPTTPTATTAPTTTRRRPPRPLVIRIRVRNGEVAGGIRRATISKGRRVRLVVTADVSDHVHLHGYDLTRDVAPGSPARLAFRATIVGRFEVELEDRKLPIAELEVRA